MLWSTHIVLVLTFVLGVGSSRIISEPGYSTQACFFVRATTASAKTDGRKRLAAVASTWGSKHSLAKGAKIYYMIDEDKAPFHVPNTVKREQLIPTPKAEYNHLETREKFMLEYFNSSGLVKRCDWMALVDDDAYLNTKTIMKKLSCIDSAKPYGMGVVYSQSGHKGQKGHWHFLHGDFRIFSKAAVPMVAKAVTDCKLDRINGFEDAGLRRCFVKAGLDATLPPLKFGSFFHQNQHSLLQPVDDGEDPDIVTKMSDEEDEDDDDEDDEEKENEEEKDDDADDGRSHEDNAMPKNVRRKEGPHTYFEMLQVAQAEMFSLPTNLIELIDRGENLRCSRDIVHKLVGKDMERYHNLLSHMPQCDINKKFIRSSVDARISLHPSCLKQN